MNLRRTGLIAGGIVAGLILLLVLSIAFIPSESIRSAILQGLASAGYTMRTERFGKAFPLGISAEKMEIAGEEGAVFRADHAVVRLKLLPLFLGRLQVGADARIGTGKVAGEYIVNSGGSARIDIDRVRLEDIPFFTNVAGMQAKGELRGRAVLKGVRKTPAGDIQVEVRAAEFTGIKMGPMPLPDAAYPMVQGKLVIRGGKANLESLTLQGDGLYARLKGDFPMVNPLASAPLNMVLELMPKPEFMEKQKWVFLLLLKFQDSPGHYQLPIRGTLAHPSAF